jgi:DMSO/TMAO reductase YedYZ molybdopterin-dependent catalytic subunit
VRTINTNCTEHPDVHIEFWLGDSRGRWGGDTLIVDVNNFNGETWLDRVGNFHSDELRFVEPDLCRKTSGVDTVIEAYERICAEGTAIMATWLRQETRLSRRQVFGALAGGVLAAGLRAEEPTKRDMIVRSTRPLDLEMPLSGFADAITPVEHFFVRTHVYAPTVKLDTWRLTVDGSVGQSLALTMDDLRKMPSVELVGVLECAGNGRAFYDPPVAGLQWRHGAAGNGRWRGVRLADVLKRAGAKPNAVEALFDGADVPIGKMVDFRRSIPIHKALDPETLLAYEMNGQPLPVSHGFPLRVVVPGWAGDSWVKWVTGIRVLTEPDSNYWMASTYKHPGKPVAPGTLLPAASLPSVTSLRVKSVIASPEPGAVIKPGEHVTIRGVAWSGESGPVQNIEVSVDNGRTWSAARFLDAQTKWGWRRWELSWEPQQERFYTIFARARDAKGDVQPATQEWNQSGYLWNVVARTDVNVERESPAAAPSASTASANTPPAKFQSTCMVCHQDDVITQQRLTRAQWDREITKMTDWGAQVAPADREELLNFLTLSAGR